MQCLGGREMGGGRVGKVCNEAIIFMLIVMNIHQMNVKILIGQFSKHVNYGLDTWSDWLKSTSRPIFQ